MFTAIVSNVPHWVWALLAALVALGVSQSVDRQITLRRATLMPLALIGLSFYGVASVFGHQPLALAAWAVGLASAVALTHAAGGWRGIEWAPATQRLHVPGSWLPLMLIMGVFIAKFGVGMSLAMQPGLASNTLFASLIGLVYGAFSGAFLSRGMAMWRVGHQGLQARLA